jgi:hypothetical protein
VLAGRIECPQPLGFTATKAEHERISNCATAQAVEQLLIAAGATDATVQVTSQEAGSLLGPETFLVVAAQVNLPKALRGSWDADRAALAISRTTGAPLHAVTIMDDELKTLYDVGEAREIRPSATTRPLPGPTAARSPSH